MAKNPNRGGGSVGDVPKIGGRLFDDIGVNGLRAYSGYVREEFLSQLIGRQAQRVYREMLDNSSTVGAVMFAITQAMRRVTWRVEPANDSAQAQEAAAFVESLMEDMSHTWDDLVTESLGMLGYGFALHEIVYKRRDGRNTSKTKASSKFDDGKIGWRRLPGRGQDTILKWFFNQNGGIEGATQLPYAESAVDIPIEKCLLFRSSALKNNPEGRSILRNAYRSYFFIKRLEEQEAISVERFNGFPVIYLPGDMIDRALATGANADPQAQAAYTAYKKIVTNIRVDEQMGLVLPSDTYKDQDGKPSNVRMYELQFLTPSAGSSAKADVDKVITRHKIDILMTVLADFIQMGHEVRGTNNLAVTKVDMFYAAIEGWLTNHAEVFNRFALPRLWRLNGDDLDLMPRFVPEMPARLDLDSLGAYVAALGQAGMPLFPDDDLQQFLRGAGGMPETTSPEAMKAAQDVLTASLQPKIAASVDTKGNGKARAGTKPKAAKPLADDKIGNDK